MSGDLICGNIDDGHASRYIKPSWIRSGTLSTEAFDLRDGPPPETYVSHFLTEGNLPIERFKVAYDLISQRIKKCDVGSIAVLNISEALIEVNDVTEPFIEFVEKGLPHCGLVYRTTNQQHIQEAKATLCVLATKNLMHAKIIVAEIGATKEIE